MAITSGFQPDETGSIPVTRSIRQKEYSSPAVCKSMDLSHPLVQLYLLHLHIFFSVFFFVGIGLLFSYLKNLPQRQKKRVMWWVLILGTLGTALTVPFCYIGMHLMTM